MNKILFYIALAVLASIRPANAAPSDSLEQKLETLQNDVDQLVKNSSYSKVRFGGDFSLFDDNFIERTGPGVDFDESLSMMRARLRLTMRAEPSKYVRFMGRLAAYKGFTGTLSGNTNDVSENPTYPSLRPNSNGYLMIDRMYVDFFAPGEALSFSGGFFPATEGYPDDLGGLAQRKSTFPNLLFNVAFPGVILSFHPHRIWSVLPDLHFWAIYSKLSTPALTTYQGSTFQGISFQDPMRFMNHSYGEVVAFVGEVSGETSWSERLTGVLAWSEFTGLKTSADPRLTALAVASGLDIQPGLNLGSISRAVLHTQAKQLFDTGFSPFFAVAMNTSDPAPVTVNVVGTTTPTLVNNPAQRGAPYTGKIGLPGSINKSARYGKAIYTGLAYDFRREISPFLGAPTLGYEFFVPEKYYLGDYTAGDDVISRLENIGPSHKFFYTQPFGGAMKLQFVYSMMRTHWTRNSLESHVPAQGPITVSGVPVAAATSGSSVESVNRADKLLHFFQVNWMTSF